MPSQVQGLPNWNIPLLTIHLTRLLPSQQRLLMICASAGRDGRTTATRAAIVNSDQKTFFITFANSELTILVGAHGIEPRSLASHASTLPLSYAPIPLLLLISLTFGRHHYRMNQLIY